MKPKKPPPGNYRTGTCGTPWTGLLVLDEAGSAWELDMVDKALLQKAVRERPAARECVLTAHQPPQWMLDEADYITEMKCHRHPYQKGVPARKGIEY